MKDNVTVALQMLAVLLLCLFAICGGCYMKKWQYDECLLTGHTPNYCLAQTMGCFSGGNR